MKKLVKKLTHKGENYEIMLLKRPDGIYFLKDFHGKMPFSPFYQCVPDFGFIDLDEIDARLDQPLLKHLISQSENGVRFWADNKKEILGYLPN